MVFRLQNESFNLPHLNSKAIQDYCDALLGAVERDRSHKTFKKAADTVADVRRTIKTLEQPERTKSFTAALINAAATHDRGPAVSQRLCGTVKMFSDIRGFGFITSDDGTDVFVHYTGIAGSGYKYLVVGERVRFAIAPDPRGVHATEVEPVP